MMLGAAERYIRLYNGSATSTGADMLTFAEMLRPKRVIKVVLENFAHDKEYFNQHLVGGRHMKTNRRLLVGGWR